MLYIENNLLFVITSIGCVKFKLKKNIIFFLVDNNLIFNHSYLIAFNKIKFDKNILYFVNNLFNLLKNVTTVYSIKYKIVGLGHKVLYSKNNYLFKLGYSHMIYCLIPFNIRGKKKKKKLLFNKLYSINSIKLNNFFYYIKHLRIPDIFSMNGIFNRIHYMEFKRGKKTFLL